MTENQNDPWANQPDVGPYPGFPAVSVPCDECAKRAEQPISATPSPTPVSVEGKPAAEPTEARNVDLDAIEARAEAATEGPWHAADEHGNWAGAGPAWCVCLMRPGFEGMDDSDVDERGRRGGYLGDIADIGDSEADAEFIAHARTDVPALVAAVRTLTAENERLQAEVKAERRNHADLTSRMGFGDNITEPQADNNTIMRAWDEMSSQSMEWIESQLWRDDCYLAGHPDGEDCDEHDPALRLLNAEAENEQLRGKVERVEALLDEYGPDDCSCGYGGYHEELNPLCDHNRHAALADPGESE